jgi:hypothetical protein
MFYLNPNNSGFPRDSHYGKADVIYRRIRGAGLAFAAANVLLDFLET